LQHKLDKTKFVFDVKVGGKRYHKTYKGLASHTPKDRVKKAYDAMQEFITIKTEELSITVDIGSTVNQYFDILYMNKEGSREWNKQRLYRNKLFYDKYIKDTIGTKAIRDIAAVDLSRFNITLDHLAQRSKKVAYELLVPVFNLAIEDDLIKLSPIKKSHIPKRNQLSEKRIVTDAVTKYRAVHKAILDVFSDNPHHRALFLFGFHGRRLNEVVTLQWDDIDITNANYVVRGENSKVDADMQFSLPMDVSEALSHFRDTKGNVFNVKRVETLYGKIRTASKVEEFSFHWMRNLAVSALSSMGVEATHLSAMLGHTDAGTLRKYLSLQREQSTSATLKASQILLSHV
jgi:integrase